MIGEHRDEGVVGQNQSGRCLDPILDLHGAQLTQDVFVRRSPMGNATTSGVPFLEIPDLLGKRSSGRSH
jgi:hypothetical protein